MLPQNTRSESSGKNKKINMKRTPQRIYLPTKKLMKHHQKGKLGVSEGHV
jgi:hypothetical protein